MERNNYNKKTITELTVAEGGMISEDNDILEEIRRFYKNLYTTEMDFDLNNSFKLHCGLLRQSTEIN